MQRHKARSVPDLVEEQQGHCGWNKESRRERGQRDVQRSERGWERRGQVTHGLRTQGKDIGSYLEQDEKLLEDFEQQNDTIRHTF